MDYSVIVPVYNSKDTLKLLIDEIDGFFRGNGYTYEVIMVDDGSGDGSFEKIRELSEAYSQIKGIHIKSNMGQQRALVTGMLMAKGDWVITIDDDLQHDIRDASRMISLAKDGCDIVFGVYEDYGSKGLRAFGSKLVGLFFRLRYGKLHGLRVSSFRLVSRKVYGKLEEPGERFVYLSAELLPHAKLVGNVEVSRRERVYGKSGYDLKKCILLCIRLWFNYGLKSLVFGERKRHDEEDTDGWGGQLPEERNLEDKVSGI